MATTEARNRDFHLTVLGRTLEHLGVQMYKRRDTAIAELVANCWDAGATKADIDLPEDDYDPASSQIVVADNGTGMHEDEVENEYLVVGRNRRREDGEEHEGRRVMGRKGIGKLAGFGIATKMTVETWQEDGDTTAVTLDVRELKKDPGATETVSLEGVISVGPPAGATSTQGTRIALSDLKHSTPLAGEVLREALARRFSRTVRGHMEIRVNGEPVAEPTFDFDIREPETENFTEASLPDGSSVRYWYGFSKTVIPTTQLRGFTIQVRGKTAQAPNFFFFVEGTASGQHGTKYLTGVIEADQLDAGTDDEGDLISTDRQEIDWEDDRTEPLKEWGAQLARDALRRRANLRGDRIEKRIYETHEYKVRIERLEPSLQSKVKQYLRTLGESDAEDEKTLPLADSLIRAFEYQHFHDVIGQIDEARDASPEQLARLLGHLHEWKVLESRAILEIVKGRLDIIDTFRKLLVEDAPETAPREEVSNLHDLLGDYPWLINPEWQVLAEEKRLTTQLREWREQDIADPEDRQRYDFLALKREGLLVIIEIKRAGHAVTLDDLQRLEQYKVKLERAEPNIHMVLISGGNFAFDHSSWEEREDMDLLTWDEVHTRARTYYEHYRAVLEGDVDSRDFADRGREVQRTREIVDSGVVWRGKKRRAEGLGPQSVRYDEPEPTTEDESDEHNGAGEQVS